MHEQMRNMSEYICIRACRFLCLCLLTAEVVSSPADADLMCVADGHVRRQKITLVIFVVQVPRPHDVAELLRRHLQIQNMAKVLRFQLMITVIID